MKIILIKDEKKLGKKGDLVEVSDGYARNYILPKKIGVEANAGNLNDLKLKNANDEKVAKENLEAAQALAKAGSGGRSFGSVAGKEIAAAAKEQLGIEIDKKKIVLAEPLKNFGSYDVSIKLHPSVTGVLNVKVVEE